MPDGFPLSITVDRSTPPNMPLTDDLVEKIKVVMSKRYFPENKALDLKAFHLDESFAGESFYAPLWRSNVMNRVLTIIMDNIPEVTAIDLSNNKLNSMSIEAFSSFKTKVKELRILYLADNKIQDTRGLERMRGIELAELKLTGNPVIEKIGSSYKEAIRKIFPKLLKLDDKELPKEIGFDVGDEDDSARSGELPPSVQKMIKSPEFEPTALRFLEEFFKLYDSDSRQPLLEAYHEEAVMSLSAVGNTALLPAYIPESRNLRRVDYEKKRHDLLRRGKLQIVAFLSKLPKTEHDTSTFTIDMPFASATLMTFTVTGLFRERDTKLKESIRHFNRWVGGCFDLSEPILLLRCFIVVPHGGGFCIINETLYISTATDLRWT
jgi:nuclear RNA export factor